MNKHVTLGCTFLCGIYSCAVDFDHIWICILKTQPPWIFPGIVFFISSAYRAFHTLYIFAIYSLVLAGICTALVARYNQLDLDSWGLDHEETRPVQECCNRSEEIHRPREITVTTGDGRIPGMVQRETTEVRNE